MASTLSPSDLVEVPVRVKGCCQPVRAPLAGAQVGELSAIFKALADPTRVQMIHILAATSEPVCVCDFTATFDLGQPTVSHHLAKLREAGLVISSRRGLWSFHQLNPRMSPAAREAVRLIP